MLTQFPYTHTRLGWGREKDRETKRNTHRKTHTQRDGRDREEKEEGEGERAYVAVLPVFNQMRFGEYLDQSVGVS